MGAILRPRRGTKSVADSKNFVLAKGEIFFEVPSGGVGKGLGRIKMGDGSTAYKNLPYFQELDLIAATGLSTTDKSTIRTNIGAGTSSFSGSYNDLSNKPTIPAAVAVKGNAESTYRTGNVNLTAANIGLGNVTNSLQVTVAAQTLTDAQKTQVRTNIAAASAADVTQLNNEKVPLATFMFNATSGTTYNNWYRFFKFNGARSVAILISVARAGSGGSPLNAVASYVGSPTTTDVEASFACISNSRYTSNKDQIIKLRISKDSTDYYIDGYISGTASAANGYIVSISSLSATNETLFSNLFTPASSLAVSSNTTVQECILTSNVINNKEGVKTSLFTYNKNDATKHGWVRAFILPHQHCSGTIAINRNFSTGAPMHSTLGFTCYANGVSNWTVINKSPITDLNHNQAWKVRTQLVSESDNRIAIDFYVEPISGEESYTVDEIYAFSISDYRVRSSRSKGTMEMYFDQIVSYDEDENNAQITSDASVNTPFDIYAHDDISLVDDHTMKTHHVTIAANAANFEFENWYNVFEISKFHAQLLLSVTRSYSHGYPYSFTAIIGSLLSGTANDNPHISYLHRTVGTIGQDQISKIRLVKFTDTNKIGLQVYVSNGSAGGNSFGISLSELSNNLGSNNDDAEIKANYYKETGSNFSIVKTFDVINPESTSTPVQETYISIPAGTTAMMNKWYPIFKIIETDLRSFSGILTVNKLQVNANNKPLDSSVLLSVGDMSGAENSEFSLLCANGDSYSTDSPNVYAYRLRKVTEAVGSTNVDYLYIDAYINKSGSASIVATQIPFSFTYLGDYFHDAERFCNDIQEIVTTDSSGALPDTPSGTVLKRFSIVNSTVASSHIWFGALADLGSAIATNNMCYKFIAGYMGANTKITINKKSSSSIFGIISNASAAGDSHLRLFAIKENGVLFTFSVGTSSMTQATGYSSTSSGVITLAGAYYNVFLITPRGGITGINVST